MSVNDKGIVDTLKECPENGFRTVSYTHLTLPTIA